jgi:hypothetical protein
VIIDKAKLIEQLKIKLMRGGTKTAAMYGSIRCVVNDREGVSPAWPLKKRRSASYCGWR